MNIKRTLSTMTNDIIFQYKSGFYFVYIALCIIYIAILRFVPMNVRYILISIFIYLDTSILGLFFIGGIMMLEKQQGILSLLYVTPLKMSEYIFSKVSTLCMLSLVSSLLIVYGGGCYDIKISILIVAIILICSIYTLIGMTLVPKCKSLNDYFVKMLCPMMILLIPCIVLVPNNVIPKLIERVFYFIPSVGALKLMLMSVTKINIFDIIISISGLAFTLYFTQIRAKNALKNIIID